MRVRNIDQNPDSLHQRIIADDDLGFTQAIIAQRQGCAQSTVSQVLAAERLRRLRNVREGRSRGRTGQRGSRIREGRGKASDGRPAASRGRRRRRRDAEHPSTIKTRFLYFLPFILPKPRFYSSKASFILPKPPLNNSQNLPFNLPFSPL